MSVRVRLDDDLERELGLLLDRTGPSGLITKHLVAFIDGNIRVEVRADEHPPPHFHVSYNGDDASFSIVTGERLPNVRGLERQEKMIQIWWSKNHRKIALKWNDCRPTDCQVGPVDIPD